MTGVVYILCQYDNGRSGRRLNSSPAGVSYVDYLIDVLKATGRKVKVVSIATGKNKSYFSSKTLVVDEKEEIIYLPTLRQGGTICLRLAQVFSCLQVLYLLVFRIDKEDKIILYHDRGISVFYSVVRRFIRRQYYYFIGEIFSAVYDKGVSSIQSEIKCVQGAKGYILINNVMPKLLGNISNYCVCHGRYKLPKVDLQDFNDGKIHVVYAGKIDQRNVTDAFIAVQAAKFLDSGFRMHILGYGTPKDISALKIKITEINNNKQINIVSYDGCLFGDEYDNFLMKCNVGLCTRIMTGYKANLCFPSKTIVYLAHGLDVVAPDIEVLRTSDVSNCMTYISGDLTPSKVAEAIMRIKITHKTEIMNKIEFLNNNFMQSIDDMLSYDK